MILRLSILLLCLLSVPLRADEFLFKYGIQMFQTKWTDVKLFTVGYQGDLTRFFKYQGEVGFYADTRADGNVRKSSALATGSVGFEVEHSFFYASVFWGLGFISTPDKQLSSVFEFNQDLSVGFRDSRGTSIALNYKHLSNAGITLPNEGRDFLMVRLQIPLSLPAEPVQPSSDS